MKGKKPRILIVDDQVDFILLLRSILNKIGFEDVQQRKNAYIALNEYMLFDIIFVDLTMPGLNGIDFIKMIKNERQKRKVIVVTSTNDKDIEVECLNSGADDFITKPIDTEKIAAVLKKSKVLV